MNDFLDAALAYAETGWPVFPCWPNAKAPATEHGFKDATTRARVIEAWWRRTPRANVAVATGAPGPDVLDVDTKKGRAGMELFDRARRAGLLRGAVAIVRTPSGGLHLWFEGTTQPQGAVGAGKALELKATGGYVLLPPSYVVTDDYAGTYELVERRDVAGTIDFSAVRNLLEPPREFKRSGEPRCGDGVDALVRWLTGQPEGNRNHGLFWACCRALESGHSDLAELVAAVVGPGFPRREAERTAASARRRVGVAR